MPNIHYRNRHAELCHVLRYDGVEDQTESDRERDPGSLEAKRQRTGSEASVQLHLVHQHQHGGNDHRHKRYMDRNKGL